MPAEQEKKSVNKLLEKTRGRDLSELLEQIQSLSDKDTPGFVVGDFNVPSHRDCAEKAAWSWPSPYQSVPSPLRHWQRKASLRPFAQSIQTRWKTSARRDGKLRLRMDAYR